MFYMCENRHFKHLLCSLQFCSRLHRKCCTLTVNEMASIQKLTNLFTVFTTNSIQKIQPPTINSIGIVWMEMWWRGGRSCAYVTLKWRFQEYWEDVYHWPHWQWQATFLNCCCGCFFGDLTTRKTKNTQPPTMGEYIYVCQIASHFIGRRSQLVRSKYILQLDVRNISSVVNTVTKFMHLVFAYCGEVRANA